MPTPARRAASSYWGCGLSTLQAMSGLGLWVAVIVLITYLGHFSPAEGAQKGVIVDPIAPAVSEPQNVPTDNFEYVFHLPVGRSQEQYDNYLVVNEFLERPWNLGLKNLGFPETRFTRNEAEFARALWETESNYWHFSPVENPDAVFDSQGRALYTSETGCASITQGCNAVCPKELWVELQTNIWCGAKYLQQLLDQYGHDYIRVAAAYKGAFLMKDTDGDGKKDTVVFGSDGKEEYDTELFGQVAAVFDKDLLTVIDN